MRTLIKPGIMGLFVLMLSTLALTPAYAQGGLAVQHARGVSYVSGGVGQGERDALQEMQGRFNVKLVFALTAGNYLADVHVRILNHRGDEVLKTVANGPILLAKLPPGRYTVEATSYNDQKIKRIRVGGRMTRAHFYWHHSTL